MKRVAANVVMFGGVEKNLVIERDSDGRVTRLIRIDDCGVEPSGTAFYNGVITTDIDSVNVAPGVVLSAAVCRPLAVGYSGRLLLWQHMSLADFVITDKTTVREL